MRISAIKTYNFHNINKPVNNKFQNSFKNTGMKQLYSFYYTNNISFGVSNVNKLYHIGEENFPNDYILNKTKQAFTNGETTTIYEIHQDYYGELLNCKTLEEAKEKYPEFKDVLDAKDLPMQKKGIIKSVQQGKVDGVNICDLSLILLQKHYVDLKNYGSRSDYWNKKSDDVMQVFSQLNIPFLNKRYLYVISKQKPDSFWQDEEYKNNAKENMKKNWTDEKFRQKQSEKFKQLWTTENFRKKQRESLNTLKSKNNRILLNKSLKMAWDMHPEIKDKMSELANGAVRLVFAKMANGESLTQWDMSLLSEYNKQLYLVMPDATKIIAQTQKEILAELKKQAYQENE